MIPYKNTSHNINCTSTWLLSHKPFKWNEQCTRITAGEARENSKATFSYGLLHMAVPVLVKQQRFRHISSSQTQDASKICQEWWIIGVDGARVRELRIASVTWWWWWYDFLILYLKNIDITRHFRAFDTVNIWWNKNAFGVKFWDIYIYIYCRTLYPLDQYQWNK